jgi:YVTN family beta-propeller protein
LVGVIVGKRQADAKPPVEASSKAISTDRKPKVIHRRLAHTAPLDLYAHDRAGMIGAAARRAPARVYVPNSAGDSVDVIDPRTYKIVDHFPVGALPQHVTPSHDLKTLYVNDDVGNTLTPIDPVTGRPGKPLAVDDPYNLYFTIDGRYAIVVASFRA